MIPWFRHPTTAMSDPRMVMLRAECGLEGVAVYWSLLELLAVSEGTKLVLANAKQVLSMCLSISLANAEQVLEASLRHGLIHLLEECGSITCFDLREHCSDYREVIEKRREAGRKGGKSKAVTRLANAQANAKQVLEAKPSYKRREEKNIYTSKDVSPLTPQWGDLTEPMEKWIRFRKELKKPLTQSSIDQLVKTYQGDAKRFADAVSFTIGKGWQGLKHPEEVSTSNGFHSPPKRLSNVEKALEIFDELKFSNSLEVK